MEFLSGWQITPDTLIMIWLGLQITRILHSHDKRITILENKDKQDG